MKPTHKYHPLYAHLHNLQQEECTLSFAEIEQLLGKQLPQTARLQKAWWSNRQKGGLQANAWVAAGYQVTDLNLATEQVTFRKSSMLYPVRREGNKILWDAAAIKALRQHLDVSQAELAERLGMRQQTISEWETGAYLPKRSTAKYLSLIAEQLNFSYAVERSQAESFVEY